MTPLEIKEGILSVKKELVELCDSITFIGSCALKSVENFTISSDFDILIILKAIKNLKSLELLLQNTFNGKVFIVQGWGLVSYNQDKKYIIHLLVDTLDSFRKRNSLFINSALKYPSTLGYNLADKINYRPLDASVLLYDGDGLYRHYNDLKSKHFIIKTWQYKNHKIECIPLKNKNCNLLDQIIYISLQAKRNYLRFLGCDIEFKSNSDNLKVWYEKELEHSDFLKTLLNYKYVSKKGITIKEEKIIIIYDKSILFLEYLITQLSEKIGEQKLIKNFNQLEPAYVQE